MSLRSTGEIQNTCSSRHVTVATTCEGFRSSLVCSSVSAAPSHAVSLLTRVYNHTNTNSSSSGQNAAATEACVDAVMRLPRAGDLLLLCSGCWEEIRRSVTLWVLTYKSDYERRLKYSRAELNFDLLPSEFLIKFILFPSVQMYVI